MSNAFAVRVLDWYDRAGRKDLPWQTDRSPYRVWVSEIMLQQTQVATVIPFFQRFVARFPTVRALADASADQVLGLWSGLGYYARARNLHVAAARIRDEFGGRMPGDMERLQSLPGIGRSTAAAILSLALGQRETILDGNVKRVLARQFAVPGWPGRSATLRRLWDLAESLTPFERVDAYNQAMMDLGATLCTRARPHCPHCPVAAGCEAHRLGRALEFPGSKPQRTLPRKRVQMLVIRDASGALLLEKRPPTGVWGGLWSLPEIAADGDPLAWCATALSERGELCRELAPRSHAFSHFHLDIRPVEILLQNPGSQVMEDDRRLWYNPARPLSLGLAAPVARLLAEVSD